MLLLQRLESRRIGERIGQRQHLVIPPGLVERGDQVVQFTGIAGIAAALGLCFLDIGAQSGRHIGAGIPFEVGPKRGVAAIGEQAQIRIWRGYTVKQRTGGVNIAGLGLAHEQGFADGVPVATGQGAKERRADETTVQRQGKIRPARRFKLAIEPDQIPDGIVKPARIGGLGGSGDQAIDCRFILLRLQRDHHACDRCNGGAVHLFVPDQQRISVVIPLFFDRALQIKGQFDTRIGGVE